MTGDFDRIERFRTSRLIAERLQAGDLADLHRLHRDPRVMATLGGPLSEAATRQALDSGLAHWTRHGYGIWVLRDLTTGHFAGRAGLRNITIGGRDEVELLYALMPECWGNGLATEIAAALLRVAFEELRLPDIVAFTLPTNRASRRVMEKVGCRYERDVIHAHLTHVLYRISASDWAQRTGARHLPS